jgi:hypothetical protein
LNCKNQIGDQKLKEVPHSETLSAMCGRDARSVSEEKGNAAIYTQVLRLAPNHWALATMQHPRGGKIMTSKRRRLPNRRSCFLSELRAIRRCRHVRQPFISHDAISAELDDRLAARTEFHAKKFLLTVRLLTELLRRAAEIDPEAASLLSVHPRNVDGAILLVHLRG